MQDLLGGRQDMDFLSGYFVKRSEEELCKALKLQVECNNVGCRMAMTIYCWKLCSGGDWVWSDRTLASWARRDKGGWKEMLILGHWENQGGFYPELELVRQSWVILRILWILILSRAYLRFFFCIEAIQQRLFSYKMWAKVDPHRRLYTYKGEL